MEKNRDSVGDVMLIARRGKGAKDFALGIVQLLG